MDTQEAPPTAPVSKERQPFARYYRREILLVVVLVIIAAFCTPIIVHNVAEGNKDEAARDHFVAIRTQEAKQLTSGGVVAQDHWYWRDRNDIVEVTVKVGSCPEVKAYLRTPVRPQKLSDVSALILKVSSMNRGAPEAHIAVTAPNLKIALFNSGLAQCVAGDEHFE